jgi:hypothetical protein
MVELLAVFRMQTGTMLERTVNDHRDFPWQPFEGSPRSCTLLGLFLGEALSRGDRHVAMVCQHLTALGCVQSRKTCGFFEGMFRGHDHQKQQITGADPLKTSTDPDTTRDPSL